MKHSRVLVIFCLALWLPLQSVALSLLPCEQLLHGEGDFAALDCHGEQAAALENAAEAVSDCVHCEGLCRNAPNLLLLDAQDTLAAVTLHDSAELQLLPPAIALDGLRRPPRQLP